MRSGPKVTADQLEAKVIELETRCLEYKALLLQSESFIQKVNPARFALSERLTAVDLAWRQWARVPSPNALSNPQPTPLGPPLGPEARVPIPAAPILNPKPPEPPRRRVGRPTRWEQMLEEQYRQAAITEQRVEARTKVVREEWGVDEETAHDIMRAETELLTTYKGVTSYTMKGEK